MGLENSSNARKNFVNIFDGMFAIRVKEGTPNAITRTNKQNVVVHELHYDTFTNVRITKIEKKESKDLGPSWEVTIREVDDAQILNLPYSGRVTNGLFHRLPHIDLSKPVTLNLYKIEDEANAGKFKTYLTVSQGGTKLDTYWNKDNPRELPQLEQITVKNKLVWDDTKQMQYMEKYLEENIFPVLTKLNAAPVSADSRVDSEAEITPEDEDDLPF